VLASYDDMDAALKEALEPPSGETAPTKDAPAVEHLRAYLREQLEAIERHDPAVRVGSEPEDLHKLRVAVRRSRAALRETKALLGDEQGLTLRAELKWLGGRLGPARDLDVLIERLRREVADLDGPDGVPAGKVVAQLEREREAAQRELLDALDSERYADTLALLGKVVDAPAVATSDISLTRLTQREFRKLQRQVASLGPDASNDALHRARIQAKRLRYATELSSRLLGKRGEGVVSAAKTFQDVVGAHQDAVVAEEYIRDAARRIRGVGAGVAAGRLIERERERRAEARAELPDAWKRLERRAKKIWG
jgi:CHAD domain-containing protein